MKKVLLIFGVILISLGIVFGCGRGKEEAILGKYVSQKNPNEYMEIKKDGNLYMKEEVGGYSGRWKIEGNEITFYDLPLGMVVKGKIKGKRIEDETGITWMRTSRRVASGRQRQKPNEKASHYKELEETGKKVLQDKEMEEVGRRVRESMGK